MIVNVSGNLLDSGAEALVNPVNCVGIMGRGLALQFKKAHPDNCEAYVKACRGAAVKPGKMFIQEVYGSAPRKYIINFPTKRHWREKSRLEDIRDGLDALASDIRRLGINSVAVPMLGCGLGGLDWSRVRPLVEEALGGLDARVEVYATPGR